MSDDDASAPRSAEAWRDVQPFNKSLHDVVCLVSHDLRAMSRHIQIFSDMIKDPATSSDETAELADQIAGRAQQMSWALERFEIYCAPLLSDLAPERALLSEIATEAWNGLGDHALALEAELSNDIAGVVDRRLMSQVFKRLFENAEEHAGPPSTRVVLTAQERGDRVVVTIADDGRGVPFGLAERAFDPGVTTATSGAGRGLGLAFCRLAIQRHGGDISMQSARKGSGPTGACVVFDVPAA